MTDTVNQKELFQQGMAEMAGSNYGEGVRILTRVIQSDPEHKLGRIARGSCYLKQGDPDRAITDFTHAIEIDPDYARAHHLRALANEAKGDDESSLADLDRAIELNPQYGAAYYSRATVLTKMGRTDDAARDMEMVAHLSNRNIEEFANENNVWRSNHLQVESALETEIDR